EVGEAGGLGEVAGPVTLAWRQEGASSMGGRPNPLDSLKGQWAQRALLMSGLNPPAAAWSELDKRIAELKSVENWLNMNLGVLRMTIQSLEMQKAGLAAMQGTAGKDTPAPSQPAGGESPKKKTHRNHSNHPTR